jgi:hypothetical protein
MCTNGSLFLQTRPQKMRKLYIGIIRIFDAFQQPAIQKSVPANRKILYKPPAEELGDWFI